MTELELNELEVGDFVISPMGGVIEVRSVARKTPKLATPLKWGGTGELDRVVQTRSGLGKGSIGMTNGCLTCLRLGGSTSPP
jgi:hypothetical protein